jgi:hypothetical protein
MINADKPVTKVLTSKLEKLDAKSFENSKNALIDLGTKHFPSASKWARENLSQDEYEKWGAIREDIYSTYCKNKRAIEDAKQAVEWKASLNLLQKVSRKLLGEERELSEKLPHWLVGEKDHPKTEELKDANLTAEMWHLQERISSNNPASQKPN